MGEQRKSHKSSDAEASTTAAEFLEAVVDCSPDLIVAKDTELRLQFCNRAFTTLLDAKEEELIGKLESETGWSADVAGPGGRGAADDTVAEDREALAGKAVFVPSRRYRISDSSHYFDVTRSPLRDRAGRIIGVVCIWHDVTTFHTALEELREAAERYRAMSEYSHEWEVWQDAEGRILYMSPSFARITGYSSPDFLADPGRVSTIVHPDDRARYEAHRDKTVRDRGENAEPQIEFRIVRPDGEVRWIEHYCKSVFRSDGTFLGRRATNRDITATRLAEERLRSSEEKFRLVFENSPLGKSVTTIDGHLEVNRVFCEFVGYSEEELRTKTWRDITHPDDIRLTEQALAPLVAGTASVAQFEKRYLHKSGRAVRAEVITALQRDEQGVPLFYITTIRDVTEGNAPSS